MPDSKASELPVNNNNNFKQRDYVGDREAAGELAKRLQEYYHKRGYTEIRVWVEPELSSRNRKLWGIRSNIVFNVNKIAQNL